MADRAHFIGLSLGMMAAWIFAGEVCSGADLAELHRACVRGDLDAVRELFDGGLDPNTADHRDRTALHWAAYSEDPEVVAEVVARGGNTDAVDDAGCKPLLHVRRGSEAARVLLDNGADPNVHGTLGSGLTQWTPLHLAAFRLAPEYVAILLDHGAKVDARNAKGETPLHLVGNGVHAGLEMAEMLLRRGADPGAADLDGQTPRGAAARTVLGLEAWPMEAQEPLASLASDTRKYGREFCRLLLTYGAEPDVVVASMLGDRRSVADAVGVDPQLANAPGPGGMTPLYAASLADQHEIVEQLMTAGADANGRNSDGKTPLHGAGARQSTRIAEMLLLQGAQVNSRDSVGRTPLHDATWSEDSPLALDVCVAPQHTALYDSSDILRLLTENGADVDAPDQDGLTALHLAAENRPPEVLAALLGSGADANSVDSLGRTPLHLAVLVFSLSHWGAGDAPVADIGASFADVDAALDARSVRAAQLLLASGADPEVRNQKGRTPLHGAAEQGRSRTVAVLVRAGASMATEDQDGLTPADLAQMAADWTW